MTLVAELHAIVAECSNPECYICEEVGKAAERIKALEAENRRLREALEYVSCQNGRGPDGFIDWQRCVDRIQNVTRAALGEPKQEQGE